VELPLGLLGFQTGSPTAASLGKLEASSLQAIIRSQDSGTAPPSWLVVELEMLAADA